MQDAAIPVEQVFKLYRVSAGELSSVILVYTKNRDQIPQIIAEFFPDYIMAHVPESWGRYLPTRIERFLTRFYTRFTVCEIPYKDYKTNIRKWLQVPFLCDVCFPHDVKCTHEQMFQVNWENF